MIKYTSKDIIERACQLADLQNSDFISDKEKSMLLNEAWTILYQKIVNANDKSFIKAMSARDGMRLPSDFYQLSAVYVDKSREQVDRMNASQLKGYSIENDVFHISREYDSLDVVLEYYPVPQTIFYNSGSKSARSFQHTPAVIIDEDNYLADDGRVYSYSTGSVVLTAGSLNNSIRCVNGFVQRGSVNEFHSFNGDVLRSSESPIVIKGNRVTYDEVKTDEDLSSYLAVIMDESEEILYFINHSGHVYTRDFEQVSFNNAPVQIFDRQFFCRNDGLYIGGTVSLTGIIRILGKVPEVFPLGLFNFRAFVDKDDIIVSSPNGDMYRMSYGFNTTFTYPNNIYYTLLEYLLAISFKAKQQGDTALLQAQYETAEAQFLDSLSRDANQFYIMKNVYTQRGRIY